MATFVAKRVVGSLISLVILLTIVFFMSRLSGDPTNLYLPLTASEEVRDAFRREHGLDLPLIQQFGLYILDLLRLDFGESIWRGSSALGLVLTALPATLQLAGLTMLIALLIGGGLGVLAAIRPGSVFDRISNFLTVGGSAAPDFWIALVLVLIFARQLQWLPTSGTGDWRYYVLPLATLAARPIGVMAQIVRSTLIDQLSEPYTVTALSKGITRGQMVWRHATRNAAIPTTTVAGDLLVQMVNGVVVVEVVFGWPGVGRLIIDAVFNRDFAVLQAAVVVVAVMVIVINVVIDLIYVAIDPRVRLS